MVLAAVVPEGVANGGPMARASPSATASPEAGAQKARALLDKMIAALGGQAFLNYTTRSEQGRAYSFYHGRPMAREPSSGISGRRLTGTVWN